MKRNDIIALVLVLILIYVPIFVHIDVIPIQVWDEGRFAVQAFNILKTNNWLVMQYDGAPDMWLLKPPFMMWLQAISMKMFGYNELAVRLPAALAAVGTCLLVFFFLVKKMKDPFTAVVTTLVLVTIPGYVIIHCIRTGECDSLMTMFTTAYILSFFMYLDERKTKYLSATIILLTCATLTKGIQALLFLPGLLIYALYKKEVVHILKQKVLYTGIAGFLFFVLGYYFLREHYNPGYIATVLDNEVFSRYNTAIEFHRGGPMDYLDILTNQYFSYWYLPALAGIIVGLVSSEKMLKDITVLSCVVTITYLFVISNAQTQVYWYLMPLYPFLAILVGVFIYTVCTILKRADIKGILSQNVLPYVFVILLCFVPYKNICNYVLSDISGDVAPERYKLQLYMQQILHHKDPNTDGTTFLNNGYDHDLEWYIMALQADHRPFYEVSQDNIKGNEKIVAYTEHYRKFLEANYNFNVLSGFHNVVLYKLNGRKPTDSSVYKQ